jgi:hypothetical protein
MCPNRIHEQYRVAINEKDDAILSIFIINEILSYVYIP